MVIIVIRQVIGNIYGLALFDGSNMLDIQKRSEYVVTMQAHLPTADFTS